jgi:hypothetical protein
VANGDGPALEQTKLSGIGSNPRERGVGRLFPEGPGGAEWHRQDITEANRDAG